MSVAPREQTMVLATFENFDTLPNSNFKFIISTRVALYCVVCNDVGLTSIVLGANIKFLFFKSVTLSYSTGQYLYFIQHARIIRLFCKGMVMGSITSRARH